MARNKKQGDKYNSSFASSLRQRMADRNVNQADIASKLEVTPQTVSQYCNGISEPGYDNLVKIADYLDVSIDYLLGRTGDPNRQTSVVDELGLSPKIVSKLSRIHADAQLEKEAIPDIIDWIDDEPGQYSGIATQDGINLFLENTLNTIFYQDVSSLHRAVQTEMRECADFTPHNPDDLFFRTQRGKREAERYIGKLMERELGTTYPSQAGRFYVTYGLRRLTQKAHDLTDDFRELLEAMVGIDAHKQMEYREGND